jgi:hypothetical protein
VHQVGFSSNEGEEIFFILVSICLFIFMIFVTKYFEGAILKINTFLEFMNATFFCRSFIYAAENGTIIQEHLKKQ